MHSITIGMDLGDKKNQIHVLNAAGKTIKTDISIENTAEAIRSFFTAYEGALVALEAGTHSGWISRLLTNTGCEVLVGNPRKLRVIWESDQKNDSRDAEMLARIARFDPELLYPITHKGEQAQIDMKLLRSRDILVKSRASFINHVRSSVKTIGERLPQCSADSFHKTAAANLPSVLINSLQPILTMLEQLTEQIKAFDKEIEQMSKESYPETELLRNIQGVGPITALAYVLAVEDPSRFKKSRQVGNYFGLTPRQDQSGESDKQLRITKAGDSFVRRLLVQAAQYTLGAFSKDSNFRRFGLRLAARGGKNAKKRAVIAVARKLAVLMHSLWANGEIYDPLYSKKKQAQVAAA